MSLIDTRLEEAENMQKKALELRLTHPQLAMELNAQGLAVLAQVQSEMQPYFQMMQPWRRA